MRLQNQKDRGRGTAGVEGGCREIEAEKKRGKREAWERQGCSQEEDRKTHSVMCSVEVGNNEEDGGQKQPSDSAL